MNYRCLKSFTNHLKKKYIKDQVIDNREYLSLTFSERAHFLLVTKQEPSIENCMNCEL